MVRRKEELQPEIRDELYLRREKIGEQHGLTPNIVESLLKMMFRPLEQRALRGIAKDTNGQLTALTELREQLRIDLNREPSIVALASYYVYDRLITPLEDTALMFARSGRGRDFVGVFDLVHGAHLVYGAILGAEGSLYKDQTEAVNSVINEMNDDSEGNSDDELGNMRSSLHTMIERQEALLIEDQTAFRLVDEAVKWVGGEPNRIAQGTALNSFIVRELALAGAGSFQRLYKTIYPIV